MRRRRLRGVLVWGSVVAVGVAALLGFVTRGDAAGTNICPAASCLTTRVSPHVTSATPDSGFAAFAAGKFDNMVTSTATHLSLTLSFKDTTGATPAPATVTIDTAQIGTFVDGSPVAASCTPAKTTSANNTPVTSVSCGFPNLGGGHFAKLQLPFTPLTPNAVGSKIEAQLTATYGEGNGGANDTQGPVSDALRIGGVNAAGKCTAGASNLPTVTNSTSAASLSVDYPAATDSQNLPCTAVGIEATNTQATSAVGGVTGFIVSLELPRVGGVGFATVVHDVTPLPPKTTLKSLVISESLEAVGTDNFGLKVPACDSDELPPVPASPGFSSDTCVFDRSSLPKGGGRFIMHALGANLDPRYTP